MRHFPIIPNSSQSAIDQYMTLVRQIQDGVAIKGQWVEVAAKRQSDKVTIEQKTSLGMVRFQ